MGFNVRGATATLQFAEGTLLNGATVVCSLDMSIREFVAMQRLWAKVAESDDLNVTLEAFGSFAQVLVSWDLEDNDGPLPVTHEGIERLPLPTAMELFKAWSEAVGGRDPKRPSASASGDGSQAESGQTAA